MIERTCKNPACGKLFLAAPPRINVQPQWYCKPSCRDASNKAKGRPRRSPRPAAPRLSEEEKEARDRAVQQRIYEAHRAAIEASKSAPKRPVPDACPNCTALTMRDGNFAYCSARCGWALTPASRLRDHVVATPDLLTGGKEDRRQRKRRAA